LFLLIILLLIWMCCLTTTFLWIFSVSSGCLIRPYVPQITGDKVTRLWTCRLIIIKLYCWKLVLQLTNTYR
jgi:hypothetical protein